MNIIWQYGALSCETFLDWFSKSHGRVKLPLAPGFSPVLKKRGRNSRFNGFYVLRQAAEAAGVAFFCPITGLKPGANEMVVLNTKLFWRLVSSCISWFPK